MTVIDFGASPTAKRYRLSNTGPRNRIQWGIIAIDGEGKDLSDDYQAYNLLYCSNGSNLKSSDLSDDPIAIFEWILALPKRPLKVMYAFDYDVTMWLRKLPKSCLSMLWEQGFCYYQQYRLTYRPGHQFIVSKGSGKLKQSRTIWDTFRFYQQSFVMSLLEWNVGSASIRERIYDMKDQRSDFANINDEAILRYCADECDLMVELTTDLIQATIDAGVKLRRYDGAGAIANSLMRDHSVDVFNNRLPKRIEKAVLSAYYGGRTEVAMSGYIGTAYTYDINSAYPSKIIDLPCLAHARWREHAAFQEDTMAVWQVSWDVRDTKTPWSPFPFRLQSGTRTDANGNKRHVTPGSIGYPLSGMGWYWTPEVSAAIEFWGDRISVTTGYSPSSKCRCSPFEWVRDLYYRRQALKAEGNAAQRVLKLGINALYGKTAQSIGHKDIPPKYSNLAWAGMITSGCRAQVYRAIMRAPESVISSATDGIISLVPLDLPVSNILGEWEDGTVRDLWIYQPGVMSYETDKHGALRPDGTCYQCKRDTSMSHVAYKTRGFTPREVNLSAMQTAYRADPSGAYTYQTRRFIGIGAGLKRTEYAKSIGQWVTMNRKVSFGPSQRFIAGRDFMRLGAGWRPDNLRLWPASEPPTGQTEAALYSPRQSWAERWDDADMDFDALVDMAQP